MRGKNFDTRQSSGLFIFRGVSNLGTMALCPVGKLKCKMQACTMLSLGRVEEKRR